MIHYVYFIQAEDNGPIKIGHSWNILTRLCDLQEATFIELRRIGDVHCNGKKAAKVLEQELLQQLKNFCIRGEWFRATPEVLAMVPPACAPNAVCTYTSPDIQSASPFSLPPSQRPLELVGDHPSWFDNIDRENLATLSDATQRRMIAQAKHWCGSGRKSSK